MRVLFAALDLPSVIPAKAGIHRDSAARADAAWIPAFAGMTR
jgi:hypothetical protein